MGAEIPILRLLAPCSSVTKRTQTRTLFHPGRQWGEVCSTTTRGSHSACPHLPSILLVLSTPILCLCKTLLPPDLLPATECLQTSSSLCDFPKRSSSPPISILPSHCLYILQRGSQFQAQLPGQSLLQWGWQAHQKEGPKVREYAQTSQRQAQCQLTHDWSRHAGKACPGQQPGRAAFSLFVVCRSFRRRPPEGTGTATRLPSRSMVWIGAVYTKLCILTWPWRSVFSSIMAHVRQWTPSAEREITRVTRKTTSGPLRIWNWDSQINWVCSS